MATLFNTKISATYPGLIKTTDNAAITATLKQLTDGSGNATGLYLNNAGDFKVTSILEWGSLKDTGTGVTITQWVTSADGIANFNNNTSVPTSAAVKTYVDAVVTASDLDFLGDSNVGTPAVDLDSQNFSILGTTNEIETSGNAQTLTIGLPNSVTISGTFTGTTFAGDLNGTINTATTATTQSAGDNSTKVATTEYVDSLDAASDLDFSGDSGTGDVTLNTQVLAITGTTNQIVTAAANQGLSLSLPATVHRDLQGNVTGNVDGDLTGNVTATSVLADGVSATTQASSDTSTKVATTAFVKGLNNASDLDFTTDSGSGAVVLNSETFSVLGTTNQIESSGSGQAITLSLPATIHRNLLGNVTGDLTGNSDTATAWATPRDLSLTGQATATLSGVNGTLNVSAAITLDNNSVTAKVLTGLPSPSAASVLATDTIVQGIGKLQSQINGLAGGLRFMGSWDVPANDPVIISGGGEADSGTTTSTTANKLVDNTAGQNFLTTVSVGDQVVNQVDGSVALVTNVDSDTTLSLSADIMLSGEAYTIDKTPFITQGHYYVVSVGGARTINGVTNWAVGDWIIAGANNEWTKLDHTQIDGTGTGDANDGNIPRFTANQIIADSIMRETGGNLITVTGTLSTTGNLNATGDLAINTNKFTAQASTGNVAFTGDLAINTNKFTVNATSGNTLAAGTITSPTFLGDLNGTINTLTTAVTQSANNNSTKVATTAYVDTSAGLYLPLAGGTMTGVTQFNDHTNYGDQVAAKFGASQDLQIYHDGSNSYIEDTGTGLLKILTNGLEIKNPANNGFMAFFGATGAAELYFNTAKKFETTSTGISVLGTSSTFAGSITGLTSSFVSTVAGTTVVSSEGAYAGGGSVKLFEAKRNGGAVKSDWDYHDSSPIRMSIGTSTSHSFAIKTADTPRLTINSGGNVGIGVEPVASSGNIRLDVGTVGCGMTSRQNFETVITANADYGTATTTGKPATRIYLTNGGQFQFETAPANTAGQPLTFTNQLTIANTGSTFAGSTLLNGLASDGYRIYKIKLQAPYTGGWGSITPGTVIGGLQQTNVRTDGGASNIAAAVDFVLQNNTYGTGETSISFKCGGVNGVDSAERMRIESSGKVGIGVDASDYWTNANNLVVGGLGAVSGITIATDGNLTGSLIFADGTGGGDNTRGGLQYNHSTDNMLFRVNNAEQMRLANSLLTFPSTGVSEIRGDIGSNKFAIGNMGDASSQMMVSSRGFITFNTSNTGSAKDATERMRIDSSGNVAIGTDTPDQTGYGYKTLTIMGGTNAGDSGTIELLAPSVDADDQNYGILSFGAGGTRTAMISANRKAANNAANLRFWTAAGGAGIQERMRITKEGQVFIRRTVDYDSSNLYCLQVGDASLDNHTPIVCTVATTAARNQIVFSNFSSNNVGQISTAGSATSYNTSSDYRLKEDLKDFAGLDMVSKIPVYDFKWKTDESRSYGVMAHELEEVLPQAVNGEKDAEEMQSVDYSKIVPLLVKSIQELTAKVEMLEKNCNCK